MNRKASGAVVALVLAGCSAPTPEAPKPEAPKGPTPYKLVYPRGLAPESAVIPADNPLTIEKIRLGKRLYLEKRLSVDNTLSCASCHVPDRGFADPSQFSLGVGGKKGGRQAPAIVNRVFSAAQFWDGRAASLEDQAVGPMQNPIEMAMPNMLAVVGRLKEDPAYVAEFKSAYPPDGEINEANVARAIASFERTILSGNSPFDRFQAGDKSAMTEAAQRGYALFKDEAKGNCETCHASFNFTDENYNNLGVGMASAKPDMGRHAVSKLEGHQGAFKTPMLREVARTAPHMHDGSQRTLEDVVAFYDKGGHRNRWLLAEDQAAPSHQAGRGRPGRVPEGALGRGELVREGDSSGAPLEQLTPEARRGISAAAPARGSAARRCGCAAASP